MDTLYADVSEFQPPLNDLYPYRVVCFRSNDGTYRDGNFGQNYRWAAAAADSGKIAFFIVYCYWRPDWSATVAAMTGMVEAAGGPHAKMAVMLDVESGGNPGGDQSDGINRAYWALAGWLGDRARVIGYCNRADLASMWQTRPDGLRLVGAGYGVDPGLPGQVAHQYTDGTGYGGGLPEGCPPFGNCDMNSADGLSPDEFAAACGVAPASAADEATWETVWSQFTD